MSSEHYVNEKVLLSATRLKPASTQEGDGSSRSLIKHFRSLMDLSYTNSAKKKETQHNSNRVFFSQNMMHDDERQHKAERLKVIDGLNT